MVLGEMNINPKVILIVIGVMIGLPFLIWFFIKKPMMIIVLLVIGAVVLLPIVEKKLGLN